MTYDNADIDVDYTVTKTDDIAWRPATLLAIKLVTLTWLRITLTMRKIRKSLGSLSGCICSKNKKNQSLLKKRLNVWKQQKLFLSCHLFAICFMPIGKTRGKQANTKKCVAKGIQITMTTNTTISWQRKTILVSKHYTSSLSFSVVSHHKFPFTLAQQTSTMFPPNRACQSSKKCSRVTLCLLWLLWFKPTLLWDNVNPHKKIPAQQACQTYKNIEKVKPT